MVDPFNTRFQGSSLPTKRHLDRFSHSAQLIDRVICGANIQTGRYTYSATYNMCGSGTGPHLLRSCDVAKRQLLFPSSSEVTPIYCLLIFNFFKTHLLLYVYAPM